VSIENRVEPVFFALGELVSAPAPSPQQQPSRSSHTGKRQNNCGLAPQVDRIEGPDADDHQKE
jgi:hypothetical protein